MPSIKIVPDTNFFLAAILKNGYARLYLVGRGSRFLTYELYTSPEIMLEVQEKLENKFGFERVRVVESLKFIRDVTFTVYPSQKVSVVTRDHDDDKIIECALEVKADVIISLDKDLLKLKSYENIQIVHPSMLKYWFPENSVKELYHEHLDEKYGSSSTLN